MKLSSPRFHTPDRSARAGATLIVVLMVVAVVTVLIGVALQVTGTVTKLTDTSREFSALRYEAEGAAEVGYGIWLNVANNKYGPPALTDIPARVRGPNPSSPPVFNYPYSTAAWSKLQINPTDEFGVATTTPTPVPVHLDSYPGWQGFKFFFASSVRLSGTVGGKVLDYGVKRSVEYVSVPLFQAMAFFENDFEIYHPATMIVQGLVHTNSAAYVSASSSGDLTFLGDFSYVTNYTTTTPPPRANTWSGYGGSMYAPTYPNGASNQVASVGRMEPLGSEPASVLDTTDSNSNNDSMRELIERPDPKYPDPPAIAGRRLYNKAGIVILISGTTKTITTQNGVSLTNAQKTTLTKAITQQTVYDRREAKNVDISTLDMSAAKPVFDAANGFATNGLLYISDTSSTGASDPKAVRVTNGGILPDAGLTLVSDNGVYIQGDYNVGTLNPSSVPSNNNGNPNNADAPQAAGTTRAPSAVIGDAVTILSNNWKDSASASSLSSRVASHTTVNTAIMSGIVPSGWTNDGKVAPYGYSGGFNNFPRFLEDWSNKSFTYYGSMVQLYYSKNFIGQWDTGSIYAPPLRNWNYDANFLSNPPPGSLDVVTRSRGPLMRF